MKVVLSKILFMTFTLLCGRSKGELENMVSNDARAFHDTLTTVPLGLPESKLRSVFGEPDLRFDGVELGTVFSHENLSEDHREKIAKKAHLKEVFGSYSDYALFPFGNICFSIVRELPSSNRVGI